MNKAIASLAILLTVIFLSAWTPLETSNNSVVRLSLNDRDFCSGIIVERVNEDWAYMATAAHCADSTAIPSEEKIYLPNGSYKTRYYTIYPRLRILQDKVNENGEITISTDMDAAFVRSDHINDVAIYLVFDAGYMKASPMGVGKIKYGDKVYAMGMPMAIWGTISSGEVTKPRIGRTQGLPPFIPQDAIMHTAFMKPGISGGGLFNDKGELIGLTNWGVAGGPYLATRVSHVIDLLEEIKSEN